MNATMPPGLAALFGGPASLSRPDRRGLPEAQVMRLREVLDLYRTPNPYRAGDLVTARPGLLASARVPFIVLEVLPEPTTPAFGASGCCHDERFDMRVACVEADGGISAIWAASFRFEPYVERPAEAASAQAAPGEAA